MDVAANQNPLMFFSFVLQPKLQIHSNLGYLAMSRPIGRSKGRDTMAWLMTTFIGRCYVWNASSSVLVPYMEIYVWSFYYSFIVHLRGTINFFFCIAVVTCMAGEVLAFSCGMTECERCADWIWWVMPFGDNTLAFRQASLLVFIALRTQEPLLTRSNVDQPAPTYSDKGFGQIWESSLTQQVQ